MILSVLMACSMCCLTAAAAGLQRVPNTTLRVATAEPVYGYAIQNAFGNVTFSDPLGIVSPSGETNRVFVVEQDGRIAVITNLAKPNRTVFLDITSRVSGGVPTDERGLLGLDFHPGFATNGYFYVFYTGTATTAVPGGTNALHDILSRFQISPGDPNLADPASELRLLIQRDEANNHNGGDLHFGPDGYLYVAVGDEGGGNDQYNNSQTITKDFFSGLLRIDVDKRSGNLPPNPHPSVTSNYFVPSDNPFVGAASYNGAPVDTSRVRTEFWATGLRNPWRFHFDREAALLYCADVGQNLWEELNIISKGGNYGWAYREALGAGPKSNPAGLTFVNPIFQYSHGSGTNQGFSITGGVVYRGSRLSQLTGAYVFADYLSGNVWTLRYDGTNSARDFRRITTEGGVAGFGIDPSNGDVLMANQNRDTIRRLVLSQQTNSPPIPATLADTGAFSDLTTLSVNPGIVPYDVNTPFWSDGAEKFRWFSVPEISRTIQFNPEGNWQFPTGAVWIKHFEMQLTNGMSASSKRLETRFLVKNSDGVFGYTYRWDDTQTNATLVPVEGADEALLIAGAGGILRTQVWRYPSRQECNLCHTRVAGEVLGFTTAQLNRDMRYDAGEQPTNQLSTLAHAGYLSGFKEPAAALPKMTHITNSLASLEMRARSYFAANCSQCHQPGGVPQSLWDARFYTPTPQAGIVDGPLVNTRGNPEARVMRRGSVENSEMLRRISHIGPGHMPPLATFVLDTNAIQVLSAWVTNDLPRWRFFSEWQQVYFSSTNSPASDPAADSDADGTPNYLEYLAYTNPTNALAGWKPFAQLQGGVFQLSVLQPANRALQMQTTTNLLDPQSWVDSPLFDRFFFATARTNTLSEPHTNAASLFYRFRLLEP